MSAASSLLGFLPRYFKASGYCSVGLSKKLMPQCFNLDHGLDEVGSVHSREVEDNGATDHNSNVIVDGTDDVTIDKDTSDRCQGAGNNRHHRLENLEQNKKRRPEDSGLQNKGRQGFFGLKNARKVGPDKKGQGPKSSNDGRPINDALEKRRDLF